MYYNYYTQKCFRYFPLHYIVSAEGFAILKKEKGIFHMILAMALLREAVGKTAPLMRS